MIETSENKQIAIVVSYFIDRFSDIPELESMIQWLRIKANKKRTYAIITDYKHLIELILTIAQEDITTIVNAREYMKMHEIQRTCASTITSKDSFAIVKQIKPEQRKLFLEEFFDISQPTNKEALDNLHTLVYAGSQAYASMIKQGLTERPRDNKGNWNEVIWSHVVIKPTSDPKIFFQFLVVHYISQYFRVCFNDLLIEKDDFFRVMNDVILHYKSKNQDPIISRIFQSWIVSKEKGGLGRLHPSQLIAYDQVD